MASVNEARDLYGVGDAGMKSVDGDAGKDRRLTAVSRKWSSSGLGLTAAEKEARRLEKKGTFAATMDEEANTVTLSKDDFKTVMGKLGGHKETAKRSSQNLILLAFGYLAVSIGFIAVIVGLMNWRIEASKESHVKSSTMVGKDGSPVKTATSLTPAAIDSRMSDAAWKEIRYLEINSPTGAYVSLFIEAYVRIPDKNAVYDSYLEFKTSSGTIRLEGKTLTFENDISDILVKAGFEVSTGVSSTLRRLATAHQLMGLFNSISASDLQDWPGMDPLPKIPTTYHATFQMGYSCQSKTGDRCENYAFGNGLPPSRVSKFWESYVPSREVATDMSTFVLTDVETWVDADADISRTTYTNLLPYPGWALHETAIGNKTHLAQELLSTKEAIFCDDEKEGFAPHASKADFSDNWEGAYKGEVNVVTASGTATALHFTLMPKRTAGMSLDLYLKRTSATTAEPLIVAIKQGDSMDDPTYEQIVYRYTSFETTVSAAALNWYIDSGDTAATGTFNQIPYCLPDYGSIPSAARILSEHPFPGAGPTNFNGAPTDRFFDYAATGSYAISSSANLDLSPYASSTKAVMPPKKSYQGGRLRGYIQYMTETLSQMPTFGGSGRNHTIFHGHHQQDARRRLRELADHHGDEAWKSHEHVNPYIVSYLKRKEFHKTRSSAKVTMMNKPQHDEHKSAARDGTITHYKKTASARRKARKTAALQKKVEDLRRELLAVKAKLNRRLAKKEEEDEIAAEVVSEGAAEDAELSATLPDGHPQDWSDNDYLHLYLKEKDAFLYQRVLSVRKGHARPLHLDNEKYLAMQVNVLDRIKLCDMKLAEGELCHTTRELQVQGAKGRQLAASVTSWPENSNFVNSRCNSEFFFDAPLPAGTYDTKNGCYAACNDRYPDDTCAFSSSNYRGPFKSLACFKRFACRAICSPEEELQALNTQIQNTVTGHTANMAERIRCAILGGNKDDGSACPDIGLGAGNGMVPSKTWLNTQLETYCCIDLDSVGGRKFVENAEASLEIKMGKVLGNLPTALQAGASATKTAAIAQVEAYIVPKIEPYKCSTSGTNWKDWKLSVCAIELPYLGRSVNSFAHDLHDKLVTFANEILDKLLAKLNLARDRVNSFVDSIFRSAIGTIGFQGYQKNFVGPWGTSVGGAGCQARMHHQLCKGAITCSGPMVALGYGFSGQVSGGIHYDFNWFDPLGDLAVLGQIRGTLVYGVTIAGYGIEALRIDADLSVAVESNGNQCDPANEKYMLQGSAELRVQMAIGALARYEREIGFSYPCNIRAGWRGISMESCRHTFGTFAYGAGLKLYADFRIGATYVPKSGDESAVEPKCTYPASLTLTASGTVEAEACAGLCWRRWTVLSGQPIIEPWNIFGNEGPKIARTESGAINFDVDLTPGELCR